MKKIDLRVIFSNFKTNDLGEFRKYRDRNIIRINLDECKDAKSQIKLLYHEFTHFVLELYRSRLEYRKTFLDIGDIKELEEFMCLEMEKEVDYLFRSFLKQTDVKPETSH